MAEKRGLISDIMTFSRNFLWMPVGQMAGLVPGEQAHKWQEGFEPGKAERISGQLHRIMRKFDH
jgi:hypothetical protein